MCFQGQCPNYVPADTLPCQECFDLILGEYAQLKQKEDEFIKFFHATEDMVNKALDATRI